MTVATMKKFSVQDLLDLKRQVLISEDTYVEVRALALEEMLQLFLDFQTTFLQLYAMSMDSNSKGKEQESLYTSFLLASPDLVARIVATSSDQGNDAETIRTIRKRMPGTTQLLVLAEAMKLSVPDAKKAKELLSEVMALLQKHSLQRKLREVAQNVIGQTTS